MPEFNFPKSLQKLLGRIKETYWSAEKYVIDNTWGRVETVMNNFDNIFNNVYNTANDHKLVSVDRVKESIDLVRYNSSDPRYVSQYIMTALRSLEGLRGLNGAYNSTKYPDTSSLLTRANQYSGDIDDRMEAMHKEMFGFSRLGEIVNNFAITSVPELVGKIVLDENSLPSWEEIGEGVEDTIWPTLDLPSSGLGSVDYISKISSVFLEWTGMQPANAVSIPLAPVGGEGVMVVEQTAPVIFKTVATWTAGTIMKSLDMGGSIAARYISASLLKELIPNLISKGEVISSAGTAVAWNILKQYLPYVIAVSVLIAVLMKLKYDEDDDSELSQFVVFFGGRGAGFRTSVGGFSDVEEEYIKQLQEILKNGYSAAFGIKNGLPTIGITREGKMSQKELITSYNTRLALNKVNISSFITVTEPYYYDVVS